MVKSSKRKAQSAKEKTSAKRKTQSAKLKKEFFLSF